MELFAEFHARIKVGTNETNPGKPLWSLPGNPPLLQALLPAKPRLISFAGTTFDQLVSLVRYKRSRQNQLP